jgi:hypothetical protein
MSPHLIIILTISSCALLIVLLFAVRKRAKKTAHVISGTLEKTLLASERELQSLDLSALEAFSKNSPLPKTMPSSDQSIANLLLLISRYRFFQGKNEERFSSLVKEKNWNGVEQLIYEKFEIQGKNNPRELAREMTKKLLGTLTLQKN